MSGEDDLSGAGITAKERLTRIEVVLERIDVKLDNKAEKSEVIALELRTRALESRLAKYAGAVAVIMFLATIGVYLLNVRPK